MPACVSDVWLWDEYVESIEAVELDLIYLAAWAIFWAKSASIKLLSRNGVDSEPGLDISDEVTPSGHLVAALTLVAVDADPVLVTGDVWSGLAPHPGRGDVIYQLDNFGLVVKCILKSIISKSSTQSSI